MHAEPCPCGSTLSFSHCCGPLLSGVRTAATAEQLMRSRYAAYVMLNSAYLERTWHPATRPAHLLLDATPAPQWTGLKILRTTDGRAGDDAGTVEFEARYRLNGNARRMHEVSRFVREDGRWLYLEGTVDQ